MAIIVDSASNIVLTRVDVDAWWACTPEFNPSIKTMGTKTISSPFIVDYVYAINDEGEPPFYVPCYIVDWTNRAEGFTNYSAYANVSLSQIKDIFSYGATLTRNGSNYTLSDPQKNFTLIALTTPYGKSYKLPFLRLMDEVYILVNGVAITEGKDAEGNEITEASYLEDGQSWTMNLADNLPDVTFEEALSPYVWLNGGRIRYDHLSLYALAQAYDLFGDHKDDYSFKQYVSDVVTANYMNISVMGCACAEDIEIGEPIYTNKAGYVAYKEGWTDPLMAFKRDTGTEAATVVTIGVNGLATTNNYLDDDGKPYTGLVYKARPEPSQSPAFIEQFAILPTLSKITFVSGTNLDWNTQLAIEEGVCWITKKTRNGNKYSYEGVYAQDPTILSQKLLTPSRLIFPLYGGSKGVAYYGDNASLIEDDQNAWGTYTPTLESNGIVTTGYLTFTPNCLTIARNLNIQAIYVDDADRVSMGFASPICKTTTTSLFPKYTIQATAVGAAINAETYETKIIDSSEGATAITIKVGAISATAPQNAIYWFAWSPRYYDSTTATPSVSVMFGQQGITQKLAWSHCFAAVFVSNGTEITREDITPDNDIYQSYTLWKVPIGMAQQGQRVTSFIARLNFDSTKGTTGLVGEVFRIGFGSMSPLPYSES